jgi:hypothetical protein
LILFIKVKLNRDWILSIMDSFNISLYRGDTKTITASLSIDGQDVDLSSYTVTLVYRNDGRLLASGVVEGKVATFNINKALSASLPLKTFPVMLIFESNIQKVSRLGVISVIEGVPVNG